MNTKRFLEARIKGDKKGENLKVEYNAVERQRRLRASFYGIMAFDKFSWYDRDVAAITKGGRDSLLFIKKLAEMKGIDVVFGHVRPILSPCQQNGTKNRC